MSLLDILRINPAALWTLVRKPKWYHGLNRTGISWPSTEEVMDRRNSVLSARDDGMHFQKSPFYSEWWYFDSTFDNGSSMSIIVHLTDLIKPGSRMGSINIAFLGTNKSPMHVFVPHPSKQISASSEQCDVRIGESHIWAEDNSNYRLSIEERDIQAQLVFEAASAGWRPGNGRFAFLDNETFFSWVVPQPRANVKGTITVMGKTMNVRGLGYHDHNWGTVSLVDAVKEWSWGRVYLGEYSVVLADIHLSARYGGERAMPFVVLRGNEVLMSSFLTVNSPLDPQRDFLQNPKQVDFPKGWCIEGTEGSRRIAMTCVTDIVLEKADLLSYGGLRRYLIEKIVAHPYYLRCRVVAKGKLRGQDGLISLDGSGIYEQIILR